MHVGTTNVIFGYNGRDGVITDKNGLIYMRARYYSPEMRRFINADVLHGAISDSTSLNRYSYVNGNPVSFVDPFGMEKERGSLISDFIEYIGDWFNKYGKKIGLALLSSIEFEVGVGYGLGFSRKTGFAKIKLEAYSDNLTIRLDDDELFADNSGSGGISAEFFDNKKYSIGFSGSYHHDYVDRPNECEEHHAWSSPFSIATCEHADKTPMTVMVPFIGKTSAEVSEDFVIGFSDAKHLGVGYHYSIGINVTEFLRELYE